VGVIWCGAARIGVTVMTRRDHERVLVFAVAVFVNSVVILTTHTHWLQVGSLLVTLAVAVLAYVWPQRHA
jgi:hypothetical protein